MDFRSDVSATLIKHNVCDEDVVWAARVSTLGERAAVELPPLRREGLINFLMRDRHGSPFEHGAMTFRISAPIFVLREFQRHRIGWSYNEESGRYSQLQPVFYVPDEDRPLIQKGKPGSYFFLPGPKTLHDRARRAMAEAYDVAYKLYCQMLSEGVAREVARTVLPLGLFSTMYATCNPRSLMHFLSLRTAHPGATNPSFPQREIEMVGDQMEALWADLMPVTHEAFTEHGRVAP